MRVVKIVRTIRETPRGWLNKQTGHTHKTARHAQKAIERDADKMAKIEGTAVVTVITWEPTSDIGTAVVKAIT